jgi:hypothetical protein
MDDQRTNREGSGSVTKTVLFVGTVVVAVSEWLMFELMRTPYRPPQDMTTFLGQEKYSLLLLMYCVAAVWLAVLIWILTTAKLSIRDYLSFTTLAAVLLASVAYIVRHPPWTVTPWELLWQ